VVGVSASRRSSVATVSAAPPRRCCGQCSSITKRVLRSTSVPIAMLLGPHDQMPSQWTGTGPIRRTSAGAVDDPEASPLL